jgi:hypothetical protein
MGGASDAKHEGAKAGSEGNQPHGRGIRGIIGFFRSPFGKLQSPPITGKVRV